MRDDYEPERRNDYFYKVIVIGIIMILGVMIAVVYHDDVEKTRKGGIVSVNPPSR